MLQGGKLKEYQVLYSITYYALLFIYREDCWSSVAGVFV